MESQYIVGEYYPERYKPPIITTKRVAMKLYECSMGWKLPVCLVCENDRDSSLKHFVDDNRATIKQQSTNFPNDGMLTIGSRGLFFLPKNFLDTRKEFMELYPEDSRTVNYYLREV